MGFKIGNWICLILFFIITLVTTLKINEWNKIYDAQGENCCVFTVKIHPPEFALTNRDYNLPVFVPTRQYTPEYFRIQDLRYLMIILLFGAIPSGIIDIRKLVSWRKNTNRKSKDMRTRRGAE